MNKSFLLIFVLFLRLSSNAQLISVEDIWRDGKFRGEFPPSFNWTEGGKQFSEMEQSRIGSTPVVTLYSVKTKETKVLTSRLSIASYPQLEVDDYVLSPDLSKILFVSEEEAIYRRSSKANYYLYDVHSGKFQPLHELAKGKISYPTFSPDSRKIAFVRDNNIFVTETTTLKEKALTTDGKFNFILNGACDWVYEEEFEFAQAFFWSPDSKKIAYYRFDETNVKEYNMQIWGENYPQDYRYKYPKVGEENSRVKIHCALLEENTIIEVAASSPGEREYFPRLRWTGNADVLSYYVMNRLQNNLEVIHFNALSKTAYSAYKETDKAYVEINDNHFYFSDSEDFVFTSEKSGYRHIYRFSKTNNSMVALTSGAYEVAEILGVDEKRKCVYFISQEDASTERQLYSVDFSGKKKTRFTKEKGVHAVSFSPGFEFYTDTYSDANTPPVTVLKDLSGTVLQTIVDNDGLKNKLKSLTLSPVELFTFRTAQDTLLNAWKIKPINFDPAAKYPVLITVYGGPGSQEVMNGWDGPNYAWFQMLAQKGYMIVCVDGRGTGGKGAAFKKITQGNLGKYEAEDLIETAKYLKTQSYVDTNRIGVFGWSFGGYLSSLAITKGADHFKTAIAVAPVTNWRYYDNIYTERYMGLPQDNAKGYDENAPAYFASMLKGNYLLIHGTADDNVHIQNAIEMQRALIGANKQFDMFYYPDRNHGIYGGNTRYHLFKMMTEFILKKL